jgi:hypothetical protein
MRTLITRLLVAAGIFGTVLVAGAGLASASDGMTHNVNCRSVSCMTHD